MTTRSKNIIFIVLVVAASFGIGRILLSQGKSIPAEFSQSRANGGEVAAKIMSFLENSLIRLELVAKHDSDYRPQEALTIISEQLAAAKENDNSALILATQLETLARTAEDIRPSQARQIAVEAVGNEVALVSRMIVYNAQLKDLFELLKDKVSGRRKVGAEEVNRLIAALNYLAGGINELNEKFNSGMRQLDQEF